jgi:hypothetical protein
MSKQLQIANAVLWAAAIIASALLQAPNTLTMMVLPGLAAVSLLFAATRTARAS